MARNLARFDPFAGIDALRKDLFGDDLFRGWRAKLPVTDVYTRDDKELVVEAHLPNFEEKDISVNVDGGVLVIQAERHEKDEDKGKHYVLRESSSSFYRSIALPEQADAESITAAFKSGILTVTVPLKASATPKRIEITASRS